MTGLHPLLPTVAVGRGQRATSISVGARLITAGPEIPIRKSESEREWVLGEGYSLIFGSRKGTVRPTDHLVPWKPEYFPSVKLPRVSHELVKLELGGKSGLVVFATVPEEWEFSPFTVKVGGVPLRRIAGPFAITSVDLARVRGDLYVDISESSDPETSRILRLTVRVVAVTGYVRTEMTPNEDQEAAIDKIRQHWWVHKLKRHKYPRFLAFVLDALERREAGLIEGDEDALKQDVATRGGYSEQAIRDRVSRIALSLYATPRRLSSVEWNANLRVAGLAEFLREHDDVEPSSATDHTLGHRDTQVFAELIPLAEKIRAIGLIPADDVDALLAQP